MTAPSAATRAKILYNLVVEAKPSDRRLTFSLVLVLLIVLPFVLILGPQYAAAQAQGRGRAAAGAGDYTGAARYLAIAAAFMPTEAEFWEAAGLYAWQGEDTHSAIHYLEQAAALRPLTPEILITLGDAYATVAEYDNALAAWQTAQATSTPSIALLERLVSTHRLLDDHRGLVEDLDALVQLRPEGGIFLELGLLTAVEDPDQALAYLAQAAVADPDLAEEADALDRTIRRARLIDDDPAYTLTAVGRSLASLGAWDLAREAFRNAASLNPGYADAWAFLAEAQQQTGEDGLPALSTAYALDPESLVVNTFFALYLQRQGQYETALVYLETALQADPGNPMLLVEMGGTMSALGDIQNAIDLFLQAVNQDPDNPTYWSLLANFSIQNGIQIVELGLPAARQALLLAPEDPAALDLVGQAYLVMENPLLAERFFIEAITVDPQYAPAYFHFGMLHLATGDTVAARQNFLQVIALSPDTALYDQAQKIIDLYLP